VELSKMGLVNIERKISEGRRNFTRWNIPVFVLSEREP